MMSLARCLSVPFILVKAGIWICLSVVILILALLPAPPKFNLARKAEQPLRGSNSNSEMR